MCEGEAVSVNFAEKRVVILVKLRVTLSRHTGVSHHDVYTVRNVDFHLSSGKRALVNPHTTIEVVGDTGRIRATNLTLTR